MEAYFVPALPPSELMSHASAMASTKVDFPDPFSPTRNVTRSVKVSPCDSRWRTTGRAAHQSVGGRDSSSRVKSTSTTFPRHREVCPQDYEPFSFLTVSKTMSRQSAGVFLITPTSFMKALSLSTPCGAVVNSMPV